MVLNAICKLKLQSFTTICVVYVNNLLRFSQSRTKVWIALHRNHTHEKFNRQIRNVQEF